MSVLLDSEILIEVTPGRDKDAPVSLAELWAGALPPEHAALTILFMALTCVPIDQEVGRRPGDYLKRYKRSHAVDLGDALIAASTVVHGAMLWTRNRKHYLMKELQFF